MALVGAADIDVRANTTKFERELQSKVKAAADKTSANVDVNVDASSVEGAGASFLGLGAAIGLADSKLKGLGISFRDFTGIARLAGVALAGVTAGRVVFDLAKDAAALGEAQNLVTVIFDESTQEVLEFGENAARAYGTVQTEALNAIGLMGSLAKNVGFTTELAADLGIAFQRAATDIASLRNVPVEQVLAALQSGLAGESEPLRRLGIDTRELRLQQLALEEGITDTNRTLTSQERALAVVAAVARDASDAFGDFERTASSLPNQLRTMNAQFAELKTNVGAIFVPLASEVVQFVNAIIEGTNALIKFAADGIGGVKEGAKSFADDIVEFIDEGLGTSFAGIDLSEESDETLRALSAMGGEMGKLANEALAARGATDGVAQSLQDVIDKGLHLPLTAEALALIPDEVARIADEIDKITDARENLNDAIIEGEQRVDDAEKRLIQTIEDNEKRVDDAEKNLAKTRQDGARDAAEAQADYVKTVQDANERIIEAQEQREEAITDAQERLAEVRQDAEERRADAIERLHEGRLDAKERLADAEEQLDDARQQRAESLLDAALSVEDALRSGDALAERRARRQESEARRDEGVRKAAENLLDTQKDSAKDIAELEEDLAEVRIEVREDIADAEEELAETIQEQNENVADAIEEANERIAESRQRLHDLEIRLNERLMEARERLAEAEEEQAERVAEAQQDRLKAIDEANEKVADARDRLTEAAGATGDWAERLKVLNDQLERLNSLLLLSTSTGALGDLILQNQPGLQHGGAAHAGDWNWVGEAGPELVKWGSSATVVSNEQVMAALSQMATGGRGPTFNQNFNLPHTDPRVIANYIFRTITEGLNP